MGATREVRQKAYERRAEVARLVEKLGSQAAAAREMGFSPSYVHQLMVLYRRDQRRGEPVRRPWTSAEIVEQIEGRTDLLDYCDGLFRRIVRENVRILMEGLPEGEFVSMDAILERFAGLLRDDAEKLLEEAENLDLHRGGRP